PTADQQDLDDLYQNGVDQEMLKTGIPDRTNGWSGFFFFLSTNGAGLYPSAGVKLRFLLPGLRRNTPEFELIAKEVSAKGVSEVGYLAQRQEPGGVQIRDMVCPP